MRALLAFAVPVVAWPAAILVGLSLGLLGSGGSILTVPLLTQIVGLVATLVSDSGSVRWDLAAVFTAAGAAGVHVGARLAGLLSAVALRRTFAAVVRRGGGRARRARVGLRREPRAPACRATAAGRDSERVP